ncbi:hypothetical protein PG990_003932 [Apiospora arundinis]
MEPNVEFQMPNGPLDRRRLQTRIAQRKYRQKQNVARQAGSSHASGPGAGTSSSPQPLPQWPLGADTTPNNIGSSQNTVDATLWDAGAVDGTPNSNNANWVTTTPFTIDEGLLFDQRSSSACSLNAVPTSLSSGHTQITTGPEQGGAPSQLAHTISPTPWLDNQLRPQPEQLAASEERWLRPLHMAAQRGNLRILEILARHSPDLNDGDSHGRTPLIHAVQGGHPEAVSILLASGAQLDRVDRERRSALHWAVLHRRRDVLEVLLAHYARDKEAYGLYVNAYDDAGWTPLHMAIYWEFEAGVVLLLQHGADVITKAAHCPFAEAWKKASEEASSSSSSTD